MKRKLPLTPSKRMLLPKTDVASLLTLIPNHLPYPISPNAKRDVQRFPRYLASGGGTAGNPNRGYADSEQTNALG